ncbi:hypothetical protein BC937DRAFT_91675 [Endogone sp. FLAS-F59071]|nr:hypothetical protein BC937DRAFT_91675 [Endogone sp. FLAS-F59071]|eukprot:RUS16033.1 hypothetical protein BC937DRAFT_91675 [Endogone sp. FLAS-F59071]
MLQCKKAEPLNDDKQSRSSTTLRLLDIMSDDKHLLLQKDLFVGIVSSLVFHSETILLTGHGPYLKAFHVPSGKLLHSSLVLEANRIHRLVLVPETTVAKYEDGVGYENRTLIAYGAKILQILTVTVATDTGLVLIGNKTICAFFI